MDTPLFYYCHTKLQSESGQLRKEEVVHWQRHQYVAIYWQIYWLLPSPMAMSSGSWLKKWDTLFWTQEMKMSFLWRLSGLPLKDKVKILTFQGLLLHIKRSQLRFEHAPTCTVCFLTSGADIPPSPGQWYVWNQHIFNTHSSNKISVNLWWVTMHVFLTLSEKPLINAPRCLAFQKYFYPSNWTITVYAYPAITHLVGL